MNLPCHHLITLLLDIIRYVIAHQLCPLVSQLCSETVATQEILDNLVSSCRIVVEVETVTCIRLYVSLEDGRSGIGSRQTSGNVRSIDTLCCTVAVAATEGNIVLSSDHKDGAGEW